jgi:hypothetical protein
MGVCVRRLALLALLLATSCVVAAPAPLPRPQRKAEPPPKKMLDERNPSEELGIEVGAVPLLPALPVAPIPNQPRNADPPG